jgi:hypothetical protein
LKVLRNYLNKNFEKTYIQRFINPADAPILLVLKKDGEFRLYINYRDFNKITIKNRYPFLLMEEILDRLSGIVIYTKFDLKDTYYKIRIKEEDEWKTIFKIKYNHFECKIRLFDFINVSAIFQTYINKALTNFIDINYVTYLNYILIFLIYIEYQRYIQQMLKCLRQYKLYIKLFKYEFSITLIIFFGFVINTGGIEIDMNRIEIIAEWPEFKFFKNICKNWT